MEARTRRLVTRMVGVGPVVVLAVLGLGMASTGGTYVWFGVEVPRWLVILPASVLAVWFAWRYTSPKFAENRRVAHELSYANVARGRRRS